jgi:exodeoxyribonuclease VII large subunit
VNTRSGRSRAPKAAEQPLIDLIRIFVRKCDVHVYAVREVTKFLKEILESSPVLGDIWIAGEVSNVSRPASGHTYFTLKDGGAQLRSVYFASRVPRRQSTAHLIQNGHAIVAHGRVSLYEQRGDLQLYVDFVQPEGAGALQMEFERLKVRLEEEGLFDESRKRPLPRFPRRIGVITSESGAVFHDICQVLERRWPLAEVVLSPAPVQGAEAVSGIIGAIEQLNARGDIDVIIAGRGGGSIEELWAFNDELVARAIFASNAPIVSAVGHETDITIADFVADRRAPTPSAAAEIVSPDRVEIGARVRSAATTLESAARQQIAAERGALQDNVHRLERRAPDVDRLRQVIDDVARRGLAAADKTREAGVHAVGNFVWRLKSLDPFATLDRGYAVVQRGTTVVSSVATARPGDALGVRVKDGTFGVHVDGGARAASRRTKRSVPDAQAPLFTMPEQRA